MMRFPVSDTERSNIVPRSYQALGAHGERLSGHAAAERHKSAVDGVTERAVQLIVGRLKLLIERVGGYLSLELAIMVLMMTIVAA
ncbi:hypothetical protein L3X38_018891 [Prunus dulcis]|uniref:Uncharacterized protein n=1 Tax=Prunus dulcis TaxID=3755 RepID=A0AAD4WBM1_PRUDU|nr:hypothetical protein L3X38_018891 [Prunus dulcis]